MLVVISRTLCLRGKKPTKELHPWPHAHWIFCKLASLSHREHPEVHHQLMSKPVNCFRFHHCDSVPIHQLWGQISQVNRNEESQDASTLTIRPEKWGRGSELFSPFGSTKSLYFCSWCLSIKRAAHLACNGHHRNPATQLQLGFLPLPFLVVCILWRMLLLTLVVLQLFSKFIFSLCRFSF